MRSVLTRSSIRGLRSWISWGYVSGRAYQSIMIHFALRRYDEVSSWVSQEDLIACTLGV